MFHDALEVDEPDRRLEDEAPTLPLLVAPAEDAKPREHSRVDDALEPPLVRVRGCRGAGRT
eukprot:7696195-Lingulodinium_polyedra.AAC.1